MGVSKRTTKNVTSNWAAKVIHDVKVDKIMMTNQEGRHAVSSSDEVTDTHSKPRFPAPFERRILEAPEA